MKGAADMKIADCFKAAVAVAEQNCKEWIFLGNGDVFHADELHEIAKEFDEKMPLEEEDFLAVTDDGSIGLLFPGCKEPDWFFVSPEWAVVNVLQEDPRNYMVQVEGGAKRSFCKNCGTELEPGSLFCGNCGAKNAPEFCTDCGTKLKPNSKFCENCGAKVQ